MYRGDSSLVVPWLWRSRGAFRSFLRSSLLHEAGVEAAARDRLVRAALSLIRSLGVFSGPVLIAVWRATLDLARGLPSPHVTDVADPPPLRVKPVSDDGPVVDEPSSSLLSAPFPLPRTSRFLRGSFRVHHARACDLPFWEQAIASGVYRRAPPGAIPNAECSVRWSSGKGVVILNARPLNRTFYGPPPRFGLPTAEVVSAVLPRLCGPLGGLDLC